MNYQLSLTQSGDTITGVMCTRDATFLGMHDVPVTGEYPHVTFTVPRSRATFSGKFEAERDQIAGDLVFAEGGPTPLRFNRSATGRCEGAQPVP